MTRTLRQLPSCLLIILTAALCLLPVAFLILRAFDDGIEVARAVFAYPATKEAITRTLVLGGITGLVTVGLALPAAWFSEVTDMPGARAFRVLLLVPLAVPSYVSGFVVVSAFSPGGWLDSRLAWLGLGESFDVYSLTGVVIALAFTYPLAMLQIQAALRQIDPTLWQAARTLGAGPIRAFTTVVLPALRAPAASGGLLVALYAIGDFGAVSLLRYDSLSYLIYVRHKSLFERNEVIPLALLLAIVVLVLAIIALAVGGRTQNALRTTSTHRVWPTIRLGAWKWLALAYCSALVLFFVGLPLGNVGFWLARGVSLGAELEIPWEEASHSVQLAVISAGLLIAIALLPALLGRFTASRLAQGVRWVTFISYAIPGIVVAFAFVSFAVRWVDAIYQTLSLLLLAYVVRYLALALRSLEDGFARLDKRLFEAARTLGASPTRAYVSVIIPTAAPAIVAAAFAVGVAVMKELPAAMILAPLEYDTLATRIWTLTEDAFYALASVPILMLLTAAVAALLVGRRLE